MIYIILLIVIFLCYLSYLKYKILFNPFILSIQVPLLFLLVPQSILIIGFNGEDSLLSDIVIFIYTVCIYIGCKIKPIKIKIPKLSNLKLTTTILSILAITLSLPLIPVLLRYGLTFRGLREFYEYIVFSPFSSIYAIVKILLSCIIAILFIKRKKITSTIIILSVILIFSGSKMAIFSSFLLFGTLWEQYKKMNYKKLAICTIILGVAMIGYHATQNTAENVDAIKGAMSYFDVYRQQSMALEMLTTGKIDYFYGRISFSSYYSMIPRLLWPDKPKDFGFALLNYKIYPEYSADGYMPSFGLAYIFADFGYISILFNGLFTGFLKNLWYFNFKRNGKNIPSLLLYVLSIDIVVSVILFIAYFISSLKPKYLKL